MLRGTFEATTVHILSKWLAGFLTSEEAMIELAKASSEYDIEIEPNPDKR